MLLCLDARLQLAGPTGTREVALEDFLVGPFEVGLRSGEVLESVTVQALSPTQRAAYQKFQVHEYPMLGLGLLLDFSDNHTIARARVAVGSVSPTPRRSPAAEQLLTGSVSAVTESLDQAADALADSADLLDDLEGSADYKRHLLHVFLKRAFEEAIASAS
jgi:carbon-monoxide dehydrogenase medium subunit